MHGTSPFPVSDRHSTPPLWVWSQWVGESVSCTQDRPGYSKVAPPTHYFRPLVVLEAVARPGREAGTCSGKREGLEGEGGGEKELEGGVGEGVANCPGHLTEKELESKSFIHLIMRMSLVTQVTR